MKAPGTAEPRTARGFDRLAPLYDVMAEIAFAGRIHASQMILMPRLPKVRRALVLGGGTGRFLASFMSHDSSARAVSIDASAGMTRRTAARLAKEGSFERVELRVGGLETLGDKDRFDLVVTHCFLDLFEEGELEGVMATVNRALEPSGYWLFSDFALGRGNAGALVRTSIVAVLYAFFRATCGIGAKELPNFDRAFEKIGLKPAASASLVQGLLVSRLLQKPA